ncbi:MAG: hexose kinase [Candidatus Acidiferrales bacterium]
MTAHATIVCLSANPAMDRRLRVAALRPGEINRVSAVEGMPGGKASHVALAAHALGARAVWIGLAGGAIGQECVRGLRDLGIEAIAVPTAAATRVNLEIIEDSGRITEILEPGSVPAADERERMLRSCSDALAAAGARSVVAISGSLPAGTPPEFCAELVKCGRSRGNLTLLDSSGAALGIALGAGPDLVKPNRAEVEALLGRKLSGVPELLDAAREWVARGARSAAITIGADGIVWLEHAQGPMWQARPPQVQAISTVGCGDATLAGFACAYAQGLTGEAAIRLAAAAGAANCIAPLPGRISLGSVESFAPRIDVQRLA